MLSVISLAVISIVSYIVVINTHDNFVEILSVSTLIVSLIMLVVALALCGNEKLNGDIEYKNAYYQREVLEYRLENIEKNNVGNEYLYNDIVEFNNSLRSTKKWANNSWTNWFNNQRIAELDYIELPYNN